MRLKQLRFGAFKSLYDVTCDFEDLTAVTGPNGAGKSNLADGIAFIGDAYSYSLELAVARAGGYDSIAHRRTRRARTPVSFEIHVTVPTRELGSLGRLITPVIPDIRRHDRSLFFKHRFSIRAEGQALTSVFRVEEDDMVVSGAGQDILRMSRTNGGRAKTWTNDLFSDMGEAPPNRNPLYPFTSRSYLELIAEQAASSPSDLLINIIPSAGLLNRIVRSLADLRIFQLAPNQCRLSGVPTPNASLNRHGENLPAVADFLQKHVASAWTRIEGAMRAIIPRLEVIEVIHTEDRRLALQFREAGVRRPWNANEVSDGTIQALALFTAIFDERTPLLVVEEPENSLHPWILRHFVDLCRESGKQVILTTHSPVLINYLPPGSLRFMWQSDGKSRWASLYDLDPSLVDLWKNGEVQAFEGYDQGLFPEVVPQHFSSRD